MKLLLFGLILIYTNYLICQESNSKFYKQYKSFKCTKEVSKARAKFCRTESTCKNGDSSIIVKDLKDAFYVFYNSKLDGLITDNFIVLKK